MLSLAEFILSPDDDGYAADICGLCDEPTEIGHRSLPIDLPELGLTRCCRACYEDALAEELGITLSELDLVLAQAGLD